MDNKEFRKLFGITAKYNGFESAFGGWFRESMECIIVLSLQKSNLGDYFDLNIKIFIKGIFGYSYVINKDLIKNDTGDVFRRQPQEYSEVFNLDARMDEAERKNKLEILFGKFINPFTDKSLLISGILEQAEMSEVALLPAVKAALSISKLSQ
ncbi:MAG: DUF4304 domain-containing protein [Bacteroidota bacterium]